MWEAPTQWHEPAKFYCPACLPYGLLSGVIQDVANLPDDDG